MPPNRIHHIILFLLLFTLACNLLDSPANPGDDIANSSIKTEPTPTTLVSATPIAPPPTPTFTPSPTKPAPTATLPTATPHLAIDFTDLAPHRQAMLPEFANDVELVAARGASRYYLAVRLEPDSFDDEAGPILSGVEQVRYTNTEAVPLSEIYFRLYPNLPGYGGQMTVESVLVDGQAVEPSLTASDTALRIPLETPLAPEAAIDLHLTYQTLIPTQPQQGYNIFSYTGKTIALANFYPVIAVYDDQGWNIEIPPIYGDATYLDTSLYQVELTIPKRMVVAASGSLIKETAKEDDTKTLTFASGPMRDFYIAMRPDYQVVSEMVAGTLVNSYYPPALESGGILALRYAADALRVFNERFGPYPYAEFDVAATPTRAGGVEYPGIVVVAEGIYTQPGGFFQHATAHEVAHQWWYALVGNDQVDEPWLDESLTNYSAVIYWEEAEGATTAAHIVETFFTAPYQFAKEQGRDRAVVGAVEDFSEEEYGLFVYGKGPLFFEALREAVGDPTYFEIMRTYYAEYKYKIAQPDDLLAVIERVSDQEIEPLVAKWLQNQ